MKRIRYFILAISCCLSFSSQQALCAPPEETTIEANVTDESISPALNILIQQHLENKKYQEALTLIDNELNKNPAQSQLLYQKAAIYVEMEKWKDAKQTLNQLLKIQPNNPKALKLLTLVEEKRNLEPHNEIGFLQDEAYVSDLSSYWAFSSLHYYRLTDAGKFGGRFNYARRYGTSGKQFQIELYPQLSNNISGELILDYANSVQILFPTLQYRMALFFNLPSNFEFSLLQGGQKYAQFSNQKIFVYSFSLGKYIGNYFIWFQPYYYTPKNTMFYEAGIRRYFSDENNFISLKIGAGKLPDIGDVPPLDQMLIVNQKGINLDGQFALTKAIFIKLGLGYAQQLYPTPLHRDITNGNVNLLWRF